MVSCPRPVISGAIAALPGSDDLDKKMLVAQTEGCGLQGDLRGCATKMLQNDRREWRGQAACGFDDRRNHLRRQRGYPTGLHRIMTAIHYTRVERFDQLLVAHGADLSVDRRAKGL